MTPSAVPFLLLLCAHTGRTQPVVATVSNRASFDGALAPGVGFRAFQSGRPGGSALLFSTYVSPNTDDDRSTGGDAIALDAAGKGYVAGATLDRLVSDAFVVRLDSSGER